MRHRVIGVMGSGKQPYRTLADPLGRWIARNGHHLLVGGGGGVMTSTAQAFKSVPGARGLVIGILPARENDPLARPKKGYPNPWIDIAVRTHLPLSGRHGREPMSRNHINVLTSDVIVILPGGKGTESEAALALRYRRPAIAYGDRGVARVLANTTLPRATRLGEVADFIDRALRAPSRRI